MTAASPAAAVQTDPAFAVPADCDARIAQVLHYWGERLPAPGLLPGRQQINPAELTDLLRHLWLCDVLRAPHRFRYRLVGTSIAHVMGCDPTGRWLDEVHENFTASPAFADFVNVAETGAVAYYRGRPLFHLAKDYIWMERLMLPLARDGRTVDMLLGITLYQAPCERN